MFVYIVYIVFGNKDPANDKSDHAIDNKCSGHKDWEEDEPNDISHIKIGLAYVL